MLRTGLIVLTAIAMAAGCGNSRPSSPVYWHEGESFADQREDADGLTAAKAPASGAISLTGVALRNAGDSINYQCRLQRRIPDAKLWLRYSRNQWDKSPSKLDIVVTQNATRIAVHATLPNTDGWGATAKADWKMVAVDLGTLAAGDCTLTLTAAKKEHNDLNIDGFFVAPGAMNIGAEHLARADRIHVLTSRYVGVGMASTTLQQGQDSRLFLIARGFVPGAEHVRVQLTGADGKPVAVLHDSEVQLADKPITLALAAAELADQPDGSYAIRTEWRLAEPMVIAIELVGQLAATFEAQMAELQATLATLTKSTEPRHQALALDYTHAIEFLQAGWKQIAAGTATPKQTEGVKRTLAQFKRTGELIAAGRNPYEGRTGDLRFAFRSTATGKLEPFRLILPDSYRADGDMPVVLALNGNEDRFLDRADVIKQIANKRGYAIISPRASSGYWREGRPDLLQVIDVVLKRFSGLSRERVYCTGTSEGGFATYALATLHPNRFPAIACGQGAGNWRRFRRADRVLTERYTPVPTLILAGRKDPLVTAANIEQFVARLVEQGLPHEMHMFATHGHSYMNNAELYLNLTLDYFDRHTERLDVPPPVRRPRITRPAAGQPTSAPSQQP